MTEKRKQRLTTRPDGSIVDETAIRDWLAAMDRRARQQREETNTMTMQKAPQFANPNFTQLTDDEVVRRLRVANAKRESYRPLTFAEDLIRAIVIEAITPLELELVARGIPAYTITPPTEAEIGAAALGLLR